MGNFPYFPSPLLAPNDKNSHLDLDSGIALVPMYRNVHRLKLNSNSVYANAMQMGTVLTGTGSEGPTPGIELSSSYNINKARSHINIKK